MVRHRVIRAFSSSPGLQSAARLAGDEGREGGGGLRASRRGLEVHSVGSEWACQACHQLVQRVESGEVQRLASRAAAQRAGSLTLF